MGLGRYWWEWPSWCSPSAGAGHVRAKLGALDAYVPWRAGRPCTVREGALVWMKEPVPGGARPRAARAKRVVRELHGYGPAPTATG